MKACQTKPRKGFTLIELLVVIAIIALLLSIIVPALNKAKVIAQKTICANNIRGQAQGVRLFSEQNDGMVPYNVGGNWFWDMSFYSTNQITQYSGVDNKAFFCPVNKMKKSDDARFWQYTWVGDSDGPPRSAGNRPIPLWDESTLTIQRQKTEFRVLSYVYMFERLDTAGNSMYAGITELRTGEKPVWIRKMSDLRNSSGTVMIADSTISQVLNDNFDKITAGGLYSMYGLYDTTNHLSSKRSGTGTNGFIPTGGNVAFADGHVIWRDYPDQLKCRLQLGQYFYW
ncbi:MAG: type II secretion system protein [Sedimentisphaerales bacterium]|nr:type II secretion system protein [Sedimentisphaerales bacterium]